MTTNGLLQIAVFCAFVTVTAICRRPLVVMIVP